MGPAQAPFRSHRRAHRASRGLRASSPLSTARGDNELGESLDFDHSTRNIDAAGEIWSPIARTASVNHEIRSGGIDARSVGVSAEDNPLCLGTGSGL